MKQKDEEENWPSPLRAKEKFTVVQKKLIEDP